MRRIFHIVTLFMAGLLALGLGAEAAVRTSYRVQLSVVRSEEDAFDLASAVSQQTQLPVDVLSHLGRYYVLAGEFDAQEAAAAAANAPAFKDFAQLDVARVQLDTAAVEPGSEIFQIQLGNFSTPDNARTFQQEAQNKGLNPVFVEPLDGFFKVRYGRFASRSAATQEQEAVRNLGYEDAFVVATTAQQEGTVQQVVSIEPLGLVKATVAQPGEGVMPPEATPPRTDPIVLEPVAPEPPPPLVQLPPMAPAAPPVGPPEAPPRAYAPALPMQRGPEVSITTQPTLQGKKKTAIPIEARVEGEADEVLLQYRLKGGVSYIKVPMVKGEDGVWRAEIPGWACTTLGVEYFIQAKKGPFRYTTEATQESPYLIQIK